MYLSPIYYFIQTLFNTTKAYKTQKNPFLYVFLSQKLPFTAQTN